MSVRFLGKSVLFIGILVFALTMFGQPTLAAKWADTPSGNDCIITEAYVVDYSAIQLNLMIIGTNFECENIPTVKIGDYGAALAITDCISGAATDSPDQVVATLPVGILDGDYLLTIQSGQSVQQFDAFPLTIGAVGPPGADGAPGVDGVDGAPGAPGVDGVDGAPGAPGVDGVDGAPGAPGADGAQGPPGSPGADGADGDPGPPGTCTCPVSEQDWLDLLAKVQTLELTLQAMCSPEPENCYDGIDNDCDSYIDCDDVGDCSTSSHCIECPDSDPFEPNDSSDLAFDVGTFPSGSTFDALLLLDPAGDTDYFKFEVSFFSYIRIEATADVVTVELFDSTLSLIAFGTPIDINLVSGSYFIRIRSAEGIFFEDCYRLSIYGN